MKKVLSTYYSGTLLSNSNYYMQLKCFTRVVTDKLLPIILQINDKKFQNFLIMQVDIDINETI